jgi:multiple sugar transport system ATP-binding protein
MDEPLSNLDAKLRVQMRAEILRIQQQLEVTTIYVTHDQTEAMTLGDLVAVIRKGRLQQVDSPQVLYSRPANLFVAGFIGSPAMNMVEAKVSSGDGPTSITFAGQSLHVPDEVLVARPGLAAYRDRTVIVGIRPEHMDDASLVPNAGPGSRIAVTIDLVEGMGSDVYLHFSVDAPPIVTEHTKELAEDIDEKALQELETQAMENRTPFIARAGPETTAQTGDEREIFVDTRKLYFFDPETGAAIEGEPERGSAQDDEAESVTA